MEDLVPFKEANWRELPASVSVNMENQALKRLTLGVIPNSGLCQIRECS